MRCASSHALGCLLLVVAACLAGGCEKARRHDKGVELVEHIRGILIAERVCLNRDDCAAKQMLFNASTAKKTSVRIYGVYEPHVLSRIVSASADAFFKGGEGVFGELEIDMQLASKEQQEQMPFWGRVPAVAVRFARTN